MRLLLFTFAVCLAFLPLQAHEDITVYSIESSIDSKSCSSNHFCPVYVSSFLTSEAIISEPGDFVGILFPNNQSKPKGIIHPLNGDTSLFKIEKNGIYQINWALTLSNSDSSADVAEIHLIANGDVIEPIQLVSGFDNSVSTTRIPISGSVIVPLEKNTILQLQIAHNEGTLTIEAGMFSVIKIN